MSREWRSGGKRCGGKGDVKEMEKWREGRCEENGGVKGMGM